jgi:DNA-binding response OmpR family regulator
MSRILVIEDEKRLRRELVQMLRDEGHDVLEAADGREGLDLIKAERPEIVLTDIFMPNVDGFEVINTNRIQPHPARIIAMSEPGALRYYDSLSIALKLGAEIVLTKPIDWHELRAAILALAQDEEFVSKTGAGRRRHA